MTQIINLIVAATNLILILLVKNIDSFYKNLLYLPMIASVLYHLGETKHGLKGIYPFNKFTQQLLFFDRLCAYVSFVFILKSIFDFPGLLLQKNFLLVGIFGLLNLVISERDTIYKTLINEQDLKKFFKVGEIEFVIFHSAWHISAFYCLVFSFKKYAN